MLREVPENAKRTRHYYRLATGEQFAEDVGAGTFSFDGGGLGVDFPLDDPVYSNTPPVDPVRILAPGIGFEIADDITTVAIGGCDLMAFEFIVGGGGDGSGPGFGVDFAIYDDCPGDGGQLIPGTDGELTFDHDGLHIALVDLTDSPVAVPKRYWIAMEFDSNSAGWLAGTPASIGFTENLFHHPFFRCGARFGSPNFYVGFSYVAFCGPTGREFLAYQNSNRFGPRLNLNTTNWIVDDVQLIDGIEGGQCTLTSFDVAAVGTGTPEQPVPFVVEAELRTTCEASAAIPGTRASYVAVGNGLAEIAQFELEEPVPLPPGQDFFIAFRYSDPALAIVSSPTPTLGDTNPYFTYEGSNCNGPCGQCYFTAFGGVGFFANIRCLGDPPIGSCCDMAVQSPEGDEPESALCRNVPEIACQGVLTRFEPSPARCPGTCTDDETRCEMDVDCPPGEICDLNTPFDPACGHSACCKPPFPTPADEGCENLSKAECHALLDAEGNRAVWQTGQACGVSHQDCVRWLCRFAEGNCDEVHSTVGCNIPHCCDQVCEQDNFCCVTEWDQTCVDQATGDLGGAINACSGIISNDDCFADRECSDGSGPCASNASCNQCSESGNPCLVDSDCETCTNTGAPCVEDADCEGGECVPSGELCLISGATCVESVMGARMLNTCSGRCLSPIGRACNNNVECNHCNVNTEIYCEDDEDCPFLQTCKTGNQCDVDNPRSACESDADCNEAGEKCVAMTDSDGVRMALDSGSSTVDEGLCCNRNGPGSPARHGVWAKFVASKTSAELSTCPSDSPDATDSIIEVYRSEFTRECSNTGAPCVDNSDCEVASGPTGTCDPSDRVACQTRQPIACNDNIGLGCSGRPNNSRLCVDGLTIGETYLVQVAAATSTAIDRYQLRLTSPCPGLVQPPINDHCEKAMVVFEGVWAYDLADATMDCPWVGSDCLPPTGDLENPYRMTNDVWFDYFVTENGLVSIETCADNAENTPDTTLVVYSGLDCPVTKQRQVAGGCNDDAGGDCGSGSSVQFGVRVNESYRIRLGGKEGSEPSGTLSIRVDPFCPSDTPVTFVNPDGAADGDWYDARQPHALYDTGDSDGRQRIMVRAPDGANYGNGDCWELCETNTNPDMHSELEPNGIQAVNTVEPGLYEIVLARGIAPGEVTRLRYVPTGEQALFRYLPGDVNGDGVASPPNIIALIDCLNGVAPLSCELSNTDIDRSNEAGPPDILRLIDLFNGAGAFAPWLDVELDPNDCP